MSVLLTVADTETVSEKDTEPILNGIHEQNDADNEENAREAELVVFEGTTQGLGLKICGGCNVDGTQDDGIFIKRILPGGLAELQGGLEEGDLILDVNGQNMEGITYDRALSILRQASSSDHVEIVITRDEEARESFLALMSRYAATSQTQMTPYSDKATSNGEHVMTSDCLEDFQSHMAGFYQQTMGLRLDQPLEEKPISILLPDRNEKEGDYNFGNHGDINNSHYSPASSCNSELAHHNFATPPFPAAPPTTAGQTAGQQSVSLQSVLSSSFPHAVDSIGPSCKFPVAKLESTLQSLGFLISVEKHIELMKIIPVNSQGLTTFEDFVQAVRLVFLEELETRSNSQRSTPLPSSESSAPMSPQLSACQDEHHPLQQENALLRKQIEALKDEVSEQKLLCQKAEEQVLCLRKESQAAMQESRSLKTKLRLAEQSQEAARKMEQDYEQAVAMLENEISHLRLQIAKSDGINEHRRLAVVACQLKKAETAEKTYEVATNKLLTHLQHAQDVLSSESPRSADVDRGDKKKKKHKALQSLIAEGQDVIRTVQTLLEQVPLPFGWEENCTADGVRYYINHLNQTTSWTHPSSNVKHQPITMTAASAGTARGPASLEMDQERRPNNAAPAVFDNSRRRSNNGL